jgi:ornithine cyclodeaminase/alanine dehydrogenase-like protein (mu-crystallin family)
MDASLITAVRTGAAGGVAAKYLARKDSAIVGLIGTGVQGRTQVQAVNELFSLELVKAYDLSKESRERFCAEMSGKLGLRVEPVDTGRECVVGSDIVVTATYSKTPVVLDEWVDEGTHITSIGADVKGKQELDTRLYQRAKVVVDRREVALSKGLLREDQIHAELGEIIAGFRKGRENDGEITIFDASGLGIQDLAAASVVIENAKKMGLGTVVPFM